jgi:type I restriction-modification system DNA methylase subunit
MKEELRLVQLIIRILDSPNYEHYSEGKANDYLNYFKDHRADEDRLIVPVLLPKFLEQMLEFRLGKTIGAQEPGAEGKPDFIPIDKQTHPFVFDAKGSDTHDLSIHYRDKRKYLKVHNISYLILVNMRGLTVFTLDSSQPLKEYSFSFYDLYQDFQKDPKGPLRKENTRQFLRFIERFRYRRLSLEEKLERVKAAKPWTGQEELDVELLTNRLRAVVELLYQDARARREEIAAYVESDPGRAEAIAKEVEWIASEISPSHKSQEVSAQTLQEILQAKPSDLYDHALDLFVYRVAYFTMTRILLARMWEDIGFIAQTLYDGGLEKFYENSNREIRHVLRWAFQLAAERYEWLFNVENNYSCWYEPSTKALIEVLYELSNFNLGKLNQDILGTIYEEYIDHVDKKNKGQYYTPREIVSFIWDRVGFNNPKAFFDYGKGERKPKPIFDPATGSGGFLVEAARRLREESQLDFNDRQNMNDLRRAIFYGLYGTEISPFPYYITEVNLLIQYTPVIKQLIRLRGVHKKEHQREHLPLAVILFDALALHNDHKLITDQADDYMPDPLRSILPLDRRKRVIFDKIKHDLIGKFAYCCANPPYIGEKGHKELLRSTRKRYRYWQDYYQGKMDYLYWFIILGLSKLREGGKLSFITTAYWPTADGAAKLRKYILENAKIQEMVFFEDVKIFEHAKGQHNMVFVLEKCSGKERAKDRDTNRIKIALILAKHQDIPGEKISEKLSFLTRHLSAHLDEAKYEDEYVKVFWSGTRQGELSDKRWNILHSHIAEELISKISGAGKPLSKICRVSEGVKTSANALTQKLRAKLNNPTLELGSGLRIIRLLTYISKDFGLLWKTGKK